MSIQRHFDFLEQGAVAAMHITYWHIRLFKNRTRLIDD